MVNGPEARDGAAFAQSLSALKERGSNLLVVGGRHGGAQADACERLLGDHPERPRRRVFVRTDGSTRPTPDEGCGLPSERTRIVQRATPTRSATTTATTSGAFPTDEVPCGDLDTLAASVEDAVDDLAPSDGYEPGELRVCFDSLVPLFPEHDDESVFQLLGDITAAVRDVDGMGHYHLQVGRGDRVVGLLEPLFDAVIEVRVRNGNPEHNWSLTERDVESGWLPL